MKKPRSNRYTRFPGAHRFLAFDRKDLFGLNELLLSKKFIPVYFITGLLAIALFRSIDFSWLEVFLSTFLVFLVGMISFIQNFVLTNEIK